MGHQTSTLSKLDISTSSSLSLNSVMGKTEYTVTVRTGLGQNSIVDI